MNEKNGKTWFDVLNEILEAEKGKATDQMWQDLFDLSKGFRSFADACHWAQHHGNKEWKKKFLSKMVEMAKDLGQWKTVARAAENYSPTWNLAIEEIISRTKDSRTLYRWSELKDLLPEDHSYYVRVCRKVDELRQEQREKRKVA